MRPGDTGDAAKPKWSFAELEHPQNRSRKPLSEVLSAANSPIAMQSSKKILVAGPMGVSSKLIDKLRHAIWLCPCNVDYPAEGAACQKGCSRHGLTQPGLLQNILSAGIFAHGVQSIPGATPDDLSCLGLADDPVASCSHTPLRLEPCLYGHQITPATDTHRV